MNKVNRDNVFTTLDAYVFGCLILNGFILELTREKDNKVVLVFNASDELYRAIKNCASKSLTISICNKGFKKLNTFYEREQTRNLWQRKGVEIGYPHL